MLLRVRPHATAFAGLCLGLSLTGCGEGSATVRARGESPAGAAVSLTDAQKGAIADSLRRLIANAYDFSKGDVVGRLMSLYPDSGEVVSASTGRLTASRDSIEAGIRWFWEHIGRNMRDPKWTWGETHVEVLSPDAAVLTATYSIPHLTPAGAPHVVGGAWTAVFQRRNGRWVIVHEHLSDRATATAR